MHFSKYQVATVIAIIFHTIGLVGILFFDREVFIHSTFINLLLMFVLLLYTQRKINRSFIFFILTCIITGVVVEIAGTKTGWLFGKYTYGNVLGPEIQSVPLIIGVNWFIVIYCCGNSINILLTRLLDQLSMQTGKPKPAMKMASIIVDGAFLAVFFDWLMEPVAIRLGFWSWADKQIPLYNYLCWFVISSLLLSVFHFAQFHKRNKFAVNLLLIQMMFFLLLRTFL